jgi:hypothetical protein
VSDQPNDPNEIPWDAVFRPEYPQRAVLTLHDRHGRQLWSRPWLAGDASTEIEGLRTDSLGRITVLVAIDRGPTNGSVLAQLDRQGRVLWQRLVVDPTRSARLASDGLGNVFVMSSLSFEEPGVLIRRFDRDGHNPAAWKVPLFGSPSFNDGAGKVWLSSFADGPELELWTLPLSADGPSCEGQRYAWPQQLDSFFSIPTLVESEAGDVFCGTSLTIAKLSGGTP